MLYLLDTNAAIALMKDHPQILQNIRRVGYESLRLCAPVEAELWYGVAKSIQQERNKASLLNLLNWIPVLPFSGESTQHFCNIRAYLAKQGTPIGPYDLQIAAIAISHNLTLITNNTREFSRVPGLMVEDWQK